MATSDSNDRVPTWRDGVILSLEERAQLTPEQWHEFATDSQIHDLSEVAEMPEPMRSWARKAVDNAQARAHARIAHQERSAAS